MEMRTRILGKMLNSEVQDYLSRNDIIIVPVGTTEMHGGFPLDCETVISEAYCLRMAEACDGLVLTGLPYFYAGATASGRGTVQVTVRQGIDYLGAIARSLLRLGFKRQVYLSFHGPAHMTICPMIRDFYDETGVQPYVVLKDYDPSLTSDELTLSYRLSPFASMATMSGPSLLASNIHMASAMPRSPHSQPTHLSSPSASDTAAPPVAAR